MKVLLFATVLLSLGAQAQPTTPAPKAQEPVEAIVKEAKKDRKKKVEMCHECGKPEVECDCHGNEPKKP